MRCQDLPPLGAVAGTRSGILTALDGGQPRGEIRQRWLPYRGGVKIGPPQVMPAQSKEEISAGSVCGV